MKFISSILFFILCIVALINWDSNSIYRVPASQRNGDIYAQKIKDDLAIIDNKQEFMSYIETQKLRSMDYEGILIAEVIEEFGEHQKHEIEYKIDLGAGHVLNFEPISHIDPKLFGKTVHFTGAELGEEIIGRVDFSKSLGHPALEQAPAEFYLEEKSAIFFVKFANSKKTYITMNEAQGLLNGAYQDIFLKMSDGKLRHTSHVYGWYEFDRLGSEGTTSVDCTLSNQEILQMVDDLNVDLTQYTNITMIANCSEYFTIGGRASLSKTDFLGIGHPLTYIKMTSKPDRLNVSEHPYVSGWTSFISILVHERGHNFGLTHSNALDCGSNHYLQDCNVIVYGNKFDRMGGPDGSYTFNADQQRLAGWKNEETDFLHIKSNGSYRIDRLTADKYEGRKIGAYIYDPVTNEKVFMVEFRQPHYYDANLNNWVFRFVSNGVHLYSNLGSSTPERSPRRYTKMNYIDSNPTALDWHEDTAYESLTGEYFDPATGIGIVMNGVSGTKANFSVYFDDDKRVCHKKQLKDWVTRPYVRRYYEIESLPADQASFRSKTRLKAIKPIKASKDYRSGHIVLEPNDEFELRYDTFLGDHLMCERNSLRLRWHNYSSLTDWLIPKPTTGHGGSIGIDLGSTGLPSPGSGFGGGSGSSVDYIQTSFHNYDDSRSFARMIVPPTALNKNYVLDYTVYDDKEGKQIDFKVYLYIRSDRNTIIPIEANDNLRK